MKDPACPFCDPELQSKDFLLEETENFRILADFHPLIEGHILIIPKEHISCVGAFSSELFQEFNLAYEKVRAFVKKEYGKLSTFEHGNIGQSVFHSHMHVLPFAGEPTQIISEGRDHMKTIRSLTELKEIFGSKGQYLFFSIEENKWVVDTDLGFTRFFRDKFARALGRAERSDWKEMHQNEELMALAGAENERVKAKWKLGAFDSKNRPDLV